MVLPSYSFHAYRMDKRLSKTEPTKWTEADTKRTLLRVAAFLLVFLAAHWLLLWLHPLGAHNFFWNLILGALASWSLVHFLLPRAEANQSEAERSTNSPS